ncbi:MAG TPA: hypothetical protein VIH93_08705 [Thermoanaerobaculia bacterium]
MRSTKSPSWIERLLGTAPIPVAPHVFALDERRIAYGQFVRLPVGFRFRAYRAALLPPETFHLGLLGGPLRDPRAFAERLAEFLGQVPGTVRDASLVVPESWLRVSFAEVTDLPKPAEARDEVLRWKLKRLVPFRVDELRIGALEVTPLPGQQEPRRLLLGFGIEQLLGQLEDAFAEAGIRLGQITSVSLALIAALDDQRLAELPDLGGRRRLPPPGAALETLGLGGERFGALALVEEAGYTLAFVREGEPVLHRFKAVADNLPQEAWAGLVSRDLRLTRNFLDEHFPGSSLGWVLLSAPPELEAAWLARLADGLGAPAQPLDGRHLPPLQIEEAAAPWREMAPLLGAARREVA